MESEIASTCFEQLHKLRDMCDESSREHLNLNLIFDRSGAVDLSGLLVLLQIIYHILTLAKIIIQIRVVFFYLLNFSRSSFLKCLIQFPYLANVVQILMYSQAHESIVVQTNGDEYRPTRRWILIVYRINFVN